MIENSRAYKYALWCVNETEGKVGIYVKKQCRQWLSIADGKSERFFISEKEANRINGMLKIMIHPDLGTDMLDSLSDYALLFITAVLCTFKKSDSGDRTRCYSTGILEIGRKNYKTFVSAVIFIILMLTEKTFSRFFSVAPDYKLSSELMLAVKKIIKSSPLLCKHFKITRDRVTCLLTETEYTPLAYSNDRMDGKLANAFLADEDGAMSSYPVEAMRSSQITLKNGLGIIISTQYPNSDNDFISQVDVAKRILNGEELKIGEYFSLLYEPDEELIKDWEKDERVIYQSNPTAIGDEKRLEKLFEAREKAVLYPNTRANFLCKHCNIHYKDMGTEGYIPIDRVQKCRSPKNPSFWWGRAVYLGSDLSLTEDNTAVAMVTYDRETDIVYANVMGFIPAEGVERKTKAETFDYEKSLANGDCIACGDEVIDYGVIEDYIMKTIPEKYGADIRIAGFDKWNARSSMGKIERAEPPIQCAEIVQHSRFLHPATKKLKELILSGKFRYEENMLLENSFENARCVYDTNLNLYVNKKRSSGKVDMVVALINAMYLLMEYELKENEFTSYYF